MHYNKDTFFVTSLFFLTLLCGCSSDDNTVTGSNAGTQHKAVLFVRDSSQYIDLSQSGSNPFALGSGSFTIEAWVKTSLTGMRMEIFSCGKEVLNEGIRFYIDYAGKVKIDLSFTSGARSDTTVNDNLWHHVAVVNTSGSFQIYVDGVASGNVITLSPTISTEGSSSATIGNTEGSSNYFDGIIDELRIWNVARTQEVLQAFMHKEASGNESGLIGLYHFNEENAILTNDATQNHNNGTLMNGVSFVISDVP